MSTGSKLETKPKATIPAVSNRALMGMPRLLVLRSNKAKGYDSGGKQQGIDGYAAFVGLAQRLWSLAFICHAVQHTRSAEQAGIPAGEHRCQEHEVHEVGCPPEAGIEEHQCERAV